MRNRYFHAFVLSLIFVSTPMRLASQNKLLTIDDIFDPVKQSQLQRHRSERSLAERRQHYLLDKRSAQTVDFPRLAESRCRNRRSGYRFSMRRKMQAALSASRALPKRTRKHLPIGLCTS